MSRTSTWSLPALVFALSVFTAPSNARAHPLGLGSLLVVEREDGVFDVTLRLSPDEAGVARPELGIGEGCSLEGAIARATLSDDTHTRALLMRCPSGAARLFVEGLEGSDVRVLATIRRRDVPERHVVLEPDAAVLDLADDSEPVARSFAQTVALGAEHVAFGIDHVLFVLGLLLLARTPRRVLVSITGFTIGHSVTLALATLGLVDAPRAAVEVMIALSLVLCALELVRNENSPETLSMRRPYVVASAFGLVHGLGFASALHSVGLSGAELGSTLVSFNVGIEVGQLAFVALTFALSRAVPTTTRATARALCATTIGAVGVYLVMDRVALRVAEVL